MTIHDNYWHDFAARQVCYATIKHQFWCAEDSFPFIQPFRLPIAQVQAPLGFWQELFLWAHWVRRHAARFGGQVELVREYECWAQGQAPKAAHPSLVHWVPVRIQKISGSNPRNLSSLLGSQVIWCVIVKHWRNALSLWLCTTLCEDLNLCEFYATPIVMRCASEECLGIDCTLLFHTPTKDSVQFCDE